MASPAGFEPATPGLGILCSILLSYGDIPGAAHLDSKTSNNAAIAGIQSVHARGGGSFRHGLEGLAYALVQNMNFVLAERRQGLDLLALEAEIKPI